MNCKFSLKFLLQKFKNENIKKKSTCSRNVEINSRTRKMLKMRQNISVYAQEYICCGINNEKRNMETFAEYKNQIKISYRNSN